MNLKTDKMKTMTDNTNTTVEFLIRAYLEQRVSILRFSGNLNREFLLDHEPWGYERLTEVFKVLNMTVDKNEFHQAYESQVTAFLSVHQ